MTTRPDRGASWLTKKMLPLRRPLERELPIQGRFNDRQHTDPVIPQPDEWFDALSSTLTQHPTFDRRLVAERLQKLEAKLDEFFPVVQKKLFRQLIEQVVVGKDSFTVRANLKGIFDLMIELLDERYLAQLRERLNAPGEH